ncbi:condensin-2 complex subunit D3-like [Etheostoma spectabile]|uniref:condensin-2 complex subunit D3-like n=1 Tax=Etheostoma spectabile TaxID=54343 RepID=UPI0013AF12B4|nr:condensin-2 complex subunit D3-like [Etheostoma spectabile]
MEDELQKLNFGRDLCVCDYSHLVDELKDLALPFLHILLQHICFQMVEKSEFRSHGAQAVGMLTSQMASTDHACFIKWLFNYSRHSKMVCRLFSVDVVMVLLEQPERRPEECLDPELTCFLPHKFLIQSLLFARRMDDSPTVQGHALACLAQCLELPSFNVTRAVHNLFSATGTQTVLEGEITEGGSQNSQKTYRTLPFRTVEMSTTDVSDCDAKENLALLLKRVKDLKTNVRKSALQALVGLLKHNVILMSWENLAILSERCRDPAVSVKKKALQCIGELLTAKPECSVVQKAWLQGVVPAVVDSENSVQDKALEALDQVLLSQVKPYSASRHLDASQRLTWDLLALLCHDCQNLSRYFSRAFTIWSKENKFTQTFITNLISHTDADHAAGAWLLLSKVVASSPRLPYGKILDAWDSMVSSKDVNVTTCCHILCVMGDIAKHLNEDTKSRIVNDLMSWLKTFTLSLEVICAALVTLYQYGRSENIKETQAFLNHHCGELVSVCEAYLAGIILSENGAQNLGSE